MVDPVVAETDRAVAYDIKLGRRPPGSLRARFPSMTVQTTEVQTALRCQVERRGQLDALLEKLCSVGLVLTEVRRLPAAVRDHVRADDEAPGIQAADLAEGLARGATYEVRVAGELGEPLLRDLHWSHYFVPEQTLVRVAVSPAELHGFLQACTDSGARIERVRRVESAPQPAGHG